MYVVSEDRQRELLSRLVEVGRSSDGWDATFEDRESGQVWIRFWHHPEAHGGGHPVLRTEPRPQVVAVWLDSCFSTGDDDDLIGSAWELSASPEAWSAVIEWLEEHAGRISLPQRRRFIENLEVLNLMNRRSTLGKPPRDVDADLAHFKQLAERARRLADA